MKRNIEKTFKETNFFQIINNIWKKKLFIFLITFTFSLLAYFWSLSYTYTKIYSTKITLNKPPLYLFNNYQKLDYAYKHEYLNIFRSTIKKNFLDINNLENFLNQSKEYDSLKKFLISKNTTASMYFKNNLSANIDLSDQDILIINHPNKINGVFFIKSYLEYIKNISVDEIKKTLKFYLEFEINEKKNNLDYTQNILHFNLLKFLCIAALVRMMLTGHSSIGLFNLISGRSFRHAQYRIIISHR